MDKAIDISAGSWGESFGSPYYTVRGGMSKVALAGGEDVDCFHPEIQKFLDTTKFGPHEIVLVNVPLGAFEAWGQNVNGDAFDRDQIEPENPEWGHKSFETYAKSYLHHKNKDPSKGFGRIVKVVFDPAMKRIELVEVIDKNLAERVGAGEVVKKLDNGELLDRSMGCRVSFDVCSKCGHKAAKVSEYCGCLKSQMNSILPDGTVVCARNPKPKFFDLSFVIIRAAKEAAILKKVASAMGHQLGMDPVSSAVRAEIFAKTNMQEKVAATKKSDTKLADIIKHLPAIFSKLIKPLRDSEKSLPEGIMRNLCERGLPESLASTASMGIVLKPQEFQRIYLVRTGRPDVAEDFQRQNIVFKIQIGDGSAYQLNSRQIDDGLVRNLHSVLGERSALQPFISRRILVIQCGSAPPSQPQPVEKQGGVLDEVSREYARYSEGLWKLPGLLKSAMLTRGDLYGPFEAASFDPLSKLAFRKDILKPALAVLLPTYLLSAKWRADMIRGEDLDAVRSFIAQHPAMATLGVLTGAYYAGGKVPRSLT